MSSLFGLHGADTKAAAPGEVATAVPHGPHSSRAELEATAWAKAAYAVVRVVTRRVALDGGCPLARHNAKIVLATLMSNTACPPGMLAIAMNDWPLAIAWQLR